MESTLSSPPVAPLRDKALRQKLQSRRDKLQHALASPLRIDHLQNLLDEVDLALAKLEDGTFGLCETCHDPIEDDRILADPLCRNCLDHLTPKEKDALERDLSLAYQVQQGLLPKAGRVADGWSLAYHYAPAGTVSGDYCDFIPLDNGSGLFLLGDVSGKGVAASMMMTQLSAIFRSLGASTSRVPDLVARANRIFCEGTIFSFFATLACGRVSPTGDVEVCNAGHCYPLHVHNGDVIALKTHGLPLGLFNDGQYSCQSLNLAPGDSLVLYSDGISEAFNPAGDQYGTERLQRLLAQQSSQDPQKLVNAIIHDVRQFQAGSRQADDMTILVLKRDFP